MKGGAWCSGRHDRTGIISNSDPSQPLPPTGPHASVATCDRAECIAKGIKYVAGKTNQTATYSSDAERRAARLAAS